MSAIEQRRGGRHDADDGGNPMDLLIPLVARWRPLLALPLAGALIAAGITFLIPPTFTARTVFLPPPQQQNPAAAAMASLGALSNLAGNALGVHTPADQFVSLMQSATVSDRLIDKFHLMQVYDAEYRGLARERLADHVRMAVGKKDGLITVDVDDHDPARAADLANAYVEELQRMTRSLALTEAQQRRAFFEAELQQTRDRLTRAQQALQSSGVDVGAIKSEPKAAAEGYARLEADATAAEVRLQALRRSLSDSSPEVQQQLATLSALRTQLGRLAATAPAQANDEYITRYREFKYQETLFDLFSRQYELARLDESREGSLVQVVDKAMPPERKSKPRRTLIVAVTFVLTLLGTAGAILARDAWRQAAANRRLASRTTDHKA